MSANFVRHRDAPEKVKPDGGREFLRHQAALLEAPLAPQAEDRIRLAEDAAWTDKVVAKAWNRYGALAIQLASTLGIDGDVAVAVLAMESAGEAFDDEGRMLIRFEAHIFFDEWGCFDPERFAQHFCYNVEHPWQDHQWRPSPDGEWRYYHGDQDAEWEVFTLARSLANEQAAKRSISMGAPQIMGFNHERIGYETVEEMFAAFSQRAHSQVVAFFDFVNAEAARLDALRSGDLLAFATSYNGSGQGELYASLIQGGIDALRRLRDGSGGDGSGGGGNERRLPNAADLPVPPRSGTLASTDPELYAAWREHIVQGFEHNQQMFERILNAFMGPYYATVWMYRILFGTGLVSFLAAVVLSAWTRQASFGMLFGGLSAGAFLSFFLSKPLRALEENLNFITWLGVVYNSYWARLVYTMDLDTVQEDIEDITNDFVQQLQQIIDKNAELHDKRPG